LLHLTRQGARLVRAERWELTQDNSWFTYRVILPSGDWHPVSERIAIAAERRGLVTVERIEQGEVGEA
jgi:hypothetical protein